MSLKSGNSLILLRPFKSQPPQTLLCHLIPARPFSSNFFCRFSALFCSFISCNSTLYHHVAMPSCSTHESHESARAGDLWKPIFFNVPKRKFPQWSLPASQRMTWKSQFSSCNQYRYGLHVLPASLEGQPPALFWMPQSHTSFAAVIARLIRISDISHAIGFALLERNCCNNFEMMPNLKCCFLVNSSCVCCFHYPPLFFTHG